MKKIATLLGIGVLASACATGSYEPGYSYNEILIVNNSRELVRDVTITGQETGRSFSCTSIAPLGICSDRFPQRRYQETPIQVSWAFGKSASKTAVFLLEVPATLSTGLPLRGVLEISPEGEISAYFDQDSPI